MCNLYRMTATRGEVANLFGAVDRVGAGNAGDLVYPGYPGIVVAEGEVRQMHWGLPLALKGARGQMLKPRPVNNARSDKLTGPFWRASFTERRCLIPVTAWAEAHGPKGGKCRTWISQPDRPLFACAGLWRYSAEWGACYAMIIAEACPTVAGVHDRMPVVLDPADHATYLSGSARDAYALCRPYDGALAIDQTAEPWSG